MNINGSHCSAPSKLFAAVPGAERFLLHCEDGFYTWSDRLGARIRVDAGILPNSIYATDKDASFAVSSTEWKRITFADASVETLPSRSALMCHCNGVMGYRDGSVQWGQETAHSVSSLATAHRAHLGVLPCNRVVLLTCGSSELETEIPCVFTVVDKARGIVREWTKSMRWPPSIQGWKGGIICGNDVLVWERDRFSVLGELQAADFVLAHDEFVFEFRKKKAKHMMCTVRSLRTGIISAEFKLKTSLVPRIGAISDTSFLVASSDEIFYWKLNDCTKNLRSLCTPAKRKLSSELWSFVESMEPESTGLREDEVEKLRALTENDPKRRKVIQAIREDVRNGSPISHGLIQVMEKANLTSVLQELLVEDISEETRIALLSEYPCLVFTMLCKKQYGRDSMRNALRTLAPDALVKILDKIFTLLQAYTECGVELYRRIPDIPSYDETLAFLELLIDARLLDLAAGGSFDTLLKLREMLTAEVKAQGTWEKLQQDVVAQISSQAKLEETNDPIEIWQIPF